ncbi:MAG: hypothetical protein ABI325_10730 [Ginsengibacter sp.]
MLIPAQTVIENKIIDKIFQLRELTRIFIKDRTDRKKYDEAGWEDEKI